MMVLHEHHNWAFPSPIANGNEIEWYFEDGRPVRIRHGETLTEVSDPRLRLFNMSFSKDGTAFPPEFDFDTATGARLSKLATQVLASSFPSLSMSGFSPLQPRARYEASKKARLTNVPAGVYCVFATGEPAHHFCITVAGDLYFKAAHDAWVFVERLAKPAGNHASFGVACFKSGFATVLSETALICEFIAGVPEIIRQARRKEGEDFCGPPSLLERGLIVFPIRHGAEIRLAIYDSNAREWLEDLIAEGPSIQCEDGFSAPVQSSSLTPDVFWIGRDGYLTVTSELGKRLARTCAFPPGVQSIVGVPPLKDEQDTVYALARTVEHYCYVSLSSVSRTVPLSGPHLAAGRGRYIGRDFYTSLWSDEVTTFQIEAGTGKLLMPLAFTTNAKGATEGALILLVDGVTDVDALFGASTDHFFHGSLYWHSGSQLHPLQISLRFRSRFDIMLLIEEEALIVGSGLTNDFYRLEHA